MDDPEWSWPAWKFGLKRDDISTSLHDKYNTFTFTLQDPEAFHHDVCEIAYDADTTEEFHQLMAERRQQRLAELHESLETLAVEIIGNPKLMDSDHWDHALQLFRTKSFDSLVRYFASYLPDSDLAHSESRSGSTGTSFSDTKSVSTTASTKASSVDDAPAYYSPYVYEGFETILTEEPCMLDDETCQHPGAMGPLSPPESEPMQPDSPVSSSDYVESRDYESTNPPSRSMSFSGSESEHLVSGFLRSFRNADMSSPLHDCDTPITSVTDCEESHSSIDSVRDKEEYDDMFPLMTEDDDDDDFPTAQFPEDAFDVFDTIDDTPESDTPTPRTEATVDSYVQYKSVMSRRLPSPARRSASPRSHRVMGSPPRDIRRSPEEALSKIQKPCLEPSRKRPKGRA